MDKDMDIIEEFEDEENDLQMENINLKDRCARQRQMIEEIRSMCIAIKHACYNPGFESDQHMENCMNLMQLAIEASLAADEYQYNQ